MKCAVSGNMRYLAFSLLALAGCSTAGLIDKEPFSVYESERSRNAILQCLLDRSPSGELRPRIEEAEGQTILTLHDVASARWAFIIRDQGAGSITEAKRFSSQQPGRSSLETCF